MTSVTDHGDSQSVSVSMAGRNLRLTTDFWQYGDGRMHVGLVFNTPNDIEVIETLIADLQEGVEKMKANREVTA